jgi:D-aminoacyl-tRNA deacylase
VPQYRFAIVYSIEDPAGSGAAKRLAELVGAEKGECLLAVDCKILSNGCYLAGYKGSQVEFEFLDETPDPGADAIIVLSRHASSSGRPTLTTHHTGNPTSEAALGGEPATLAWSAPPLSRLLLSLYREEAMERGLLDKYEVSLEATHHGPTSNRKPLVFIEIGSTPEEWRDPTAQEAMAAAVARALESSLPECKPAAGFGGTHYPIKFTRLHLEGEYCMGHIIPKYAFNRGVPDNVIVQAVKKTWPEIPRIALIEKKSLKGVHRRRVEEILSEMGVEVHYV